jgi:hypothetical protein
LVKQLCSPSINLVSRFLSKGIVSSPWIPASPGGLLTFAGHYVPWHVDVLEFAIEVVETLVTDIVESDIEQENEHIRRIPNQGYIEEHKICYSNSQFSEASILGQRFSNNIFRTKQLFVARMIQAVVAGFVIGTIFANASNDPRGFRLNSQIGFFAFSLTFFLSSTTEGLPIYLQEMRI